MSNCQAINEIGELLEYFCLRFLDAETSGFTRKLLAIILVFAHRSNSIFTT